MSDLKLTFINNLFSESGKNNTHYSLIFWNITHNLELKWYVHFLMVLPLPKCTSIIKHSCYHPQTGNNWRDQAIKWPPSLCVQHLPICRMFMNISHTSLGTKLAQRTPLLWITSYFTVRCLVTLDSLTQNKSSPLLHKSYSMLIGVRVEDHFKNMHN